MCVCLSRKLPERWNIRCVHRRTSQRWRRWTARARRWKTCTPTKSPWGCTRGTRRNRAAASATCTGISTATLKGQSYFPVFFRFEIKNFFLPFMIFRWTIQFSSTHFCFISHDIPIIFNALNFSNSLRCCMLNTKRENGSHFSFEFWQKKI